MLKYLIVIWIESEYTYYDTRKIDEISSTQMHKTQIHFVCTYDVPAYSDYVSRSRGHSFGAGGNWIDTMQIFILFYVFYWFVFGFF